MPFSRAARRVPRRAAARPGEPRARRRRRLRGADGAAAEAVHGVGRSAAGAASSIASVYYLLPLDDRARGARRRRAAPTAGAGRADRRAARPSHGSAHAAVLAVFTFLAASSCCSRARRRPPPDGSRSLERVLPLGVIEASHFLAASLGAALLLLSQGLARRLDAAYYLAAIAIGARHRRVAAEGRRLRRGRVLAVVLVILLARASGVRSTRGVLRHALLDRLDGSRSPPRSARRSWLGDVRVQARRLLEPAVVAVRAARRGVAVPARVGRRRRARAPVRVRAAASATRRTKRREPTDARSRRRGDGDRRADRRPIRISSTCATRRCSSTSRAARS